MPLLYDFDMDSAAAARVGLHLSGDVVRDGRTTVSAVLIGLTAAGTSRALAAGTGLAVRRGRRTAAVTTRGQDLDTTADERRLNARIAACAGLRHGAAWTFVIWGALHGLFLVAEGWWKKVVCKGRRSPEASGRLARVVKTIGIDLCVVFAWIFFRAGSFGQLTRYLKVLFSFKLKTTPMALFAAMGPMTFLFCWIAVGLLAASYLTPRDCRFKTLRARLCYIVCCMVAIVWFAAPSGGEFIYFQF